MDLEPLKPLSAAATGKERGYTPAPPATNSLVDALKARGDAAAGDAAAPAAAPAEAKPFDGKAQAERINAAMARPGPSVRAEDLDIAENPFAGHVPLEAPSKYRCAPSAAAGGPLATRAECGCCCCESR